MRLLKDHSLFFRIGKPTVALAQMEDLQPYGLYLSVCVRTAKIVTSVHKSIGTIFVQLYIN